MQPVISIKAQGCNDSFLVKDLIRFYVKFVCEGDANMRVCIFVHAIVY